MRTGLKRLLKLADIVEASTKGPKGVELNMNTWGYHDGKKPMLDCGTTACMMGIAVASGAFKNAGLRRITGTLTPWCDGFAGFNAAAALFDITLEDAQYLFNPDTWGKAPTVGKAAARFGVKRIRKFVKDQAKAA